MPDDNQNQSAAPVAAPAPPEGFLHSLATSLGIDPEAVKDTARAVMANPHVALSEISSEAANELKDAATHPLDTLKQSAQGVVDQITNPNAQALAKKHLAGSTLGEKALGVEQYLTSGIPLVGGNIAKSEEQASQGNIKGMAGTLTGTVGPALLEEGVRRAPGAFQERVAQARENMAARHEASLQEARTGKVIDMPGAPKELKAAPKALPEAPPHITFEEAGGTEVHPPMPGRVAEPVSVAPQFADTLARRGQLPGQTINLSPAYGDTGGYVGGLTRTPTTEEAPDLTLFKQREDPLPRPHEVVTVAPDGTRQTAQIPAYTISQAMEKAREQFPDARELSAKPGERTPSTEYTVPTGKMLSFPKSGMGPYSPLAAMRHELGHAMIGQNEGLTQTGIIRHTHPSMTGSGGAAAVTWNTGGLTRDIKKAPEKMPNLVSMLLGGVAADEAYNNIPRAENYNLDPKARGSDGYLVAQVLQQLGYSPEDADALIHKTLDKNIEYLSQPHIADIVRENAAVREPNLSRQYHFSPERLSNMHAEAMRRANEPTQGIDNGTVGAGNAEVGATDVARAEGAGASGTGEEPGQEVTALAKQPEEHPLIVSAVKAYGVTDDPKKMGFILPDGRGLDFSQGRPARTLDHGDISSILPRKGPDAVAYNENPREIFTDRTGAARLLMHKGGVSVVLSETGMTPEQRDVIMQAAEKQGGKVDIDYRYKGKIGSADAVVSSPEDLDRVVNDAKKDAVSTVAKAVPSELGQLANAYQEEHGRPALVEKKLQVDPRQEQMAEAYAASKHAPNDPAVKKTYDALKRDIDAQFNLLVKNGFKLDVSDQDPYEGDKLGIEGNQSGAEAAYQAMRSDLVNNRHLTAWQGGAPPADHPLSAVDPKTGLTYNEKFRLVHDVFGHVLPDNDFSASGEESAWGQHRQMFSPEALPALATETRGQTAYVTKYGQFADQRAAILPKEFHVRPEDMGAPESTKNLDMPPWWNEQPDMKEFKGNTRGGKLVEDAKKNGGFTIHPRLGTTPTEGYQVQNFPDRDVHLDHAPTSEDIRNFINENKPLFAQNPNLYVGGYDNKVSGKYELGISENFPDREKAVAEGKRLNQISIWDNKNQEEIQTGGTGEFNTISTRYPWAKKITEDPLGHNLGLEREKIFSNPKLLDKYAARVKNYPGFASKAKDSAGVVNDFIDHVKGNLVDQYKRLAPEDRTRDAEWYDGANRIAGTLADKHGYTKPQAAGVIAALSPQKDWDLNVSLAKRTTDIVKNHADQIATPEMLAKVRDIPTLKGITRRIKGKSLNDLTKPADRAAWVRLYDEAHNPRSYEVINPDGTTSGMAKNMDGSEGRVAWGSLPEISKALSILEDGSRENISKSLGRAHKVRHFFNNIIEPNSPRGDVTVDTHAVAAGLMRPLSGFDDEVIHNFGRTQFAAQGIKGTYPLYHIAYQEAAKELDIAHPRQLQSMIWTNIRNIFPAEFKTEENKDAINAIWKEHADGRITAQQARDRIVGYAESRRPVPAGGASPTDQGKLFGSSLSGGTAEAGGSGGGSGDRGSTGELEGEHVGDTSFGFGANAPAEAPKKPRGKKGVTSALDFLKALEKSGTSE